MSKLLTDKSEARWIKSATIYRQQAQREKHNWFLSDKDRLNLYESGRSASIAGNYMGNAKSSWSNPQNAPPSCWKGLTDVNT